MLSVYMWIFTWRLFICGYSHGTLTTTYDEGLDIQGICKKWSTDIMFGIMESYSLCLMCNLLYFFIFLFRGSILVSK